MSYTGKPNYAVPAKRCELFITAFEKIVSEMQEKIRKVERNERVYNIVKSVIDNCTEPNEIKTLMSEHGVSVSIRMLASNKTTDFDKIVEQIGLKFKEANLHKDGIPSTSDYGLMWNRRWTVRNMEKKNWTFEDLNYVTVSFDFSSLVESGCVDRVVKTETVKRTYVDDVYTLVPRNEQTVDVK